MRAKAVLAAAQVARRDDALARQTAADLRARLDDLSDVRDRTATLEATARLGSTPARSELVPYWLDLLAQSIRGERQLSRGERRACLIGLSEAADARAADTTALFLADEDDQVRAAAVLATASAGGPTRAGQVWPFLDPLPDRPQPEVVRSAARQAFEAWLPGVSDRQLSAWLDRLRDPLLKLPVLDELIRREKQAGNAVAAAEWQHGKADVLLLPQIDQPGAAAPLFQEALLQELDRQEAESPGDGSGLPATRAAVLRTRGALQSMVLSDRLAEARRLGELVLRRRPTLANDVGSAVRTAAEALADRGDTAAARRVAENALAWDPPLRGVPRQNLVELLVQLPADDE